MPDHLNISVDALSCQRGTRMLFSQLSFTLAEGDFLQIIGANGSGKSSLLRILAGFLPAYSGAVSVEENGEVYPSLALHAHYLGHENALKTALTVGENLLFWNRFSDQQGLTPEEAVETVSLSHLLDLPVQVLSAGQKRRIAFSRLLVSKRDIWLLDEPTAALDKASDALIGRLISNYVAEGGIVIAATHLPLSVRGVEPRVLKMEDFEPEALFDEDAF